MCAIAIASQGHGQLLGVKRQVGKGCNLCIYPLDRQTNQSKNVSSMRPFCTCSKEEATQYSKILHLIADELIDCWNGGSLIEIDMLCLCPPEWTGDMCQDGMEIGMPAIVGNS